VHGLAPELLAPLAAAVTVTAAAFVLRALVLRRLIRAAGESGIARAAAVSWDGRLASLLCCVAVGLWAGLDAASLPPRLSARLEILAQALVIGTATITAAAFLASVLARFGRRQGLTLVLTGLSQTVIRLCVVVIGALLLLDHAGIRIAPLVTALGIGGLAAARPDPTEERHGGRRRGHRLALDTDTQPEQGPHRGAQRQDGAEHPDQLLIRNGATRAS
jgi:hypothetical protein